MSLVSPVLVGRHAESAAIVGAVTAARGGRGAAVFVIGAAGIGKSRLVADVVADAARCGTRVLRGRASSGASAAPFRPLTEAVFSALRTEGAPGSADLGPYWPALSRLAHLDPPDAPGSADESLVIRAEAVLRLLTLLGAESGCVLVLEDLHEADADTLAVVDYLVDNVADQPVLLLATLRTEASDARNLADAATARRAARIVQLDRLGAPQVSQLAAHCLRAQVDDLPPAALRQLHRTADGTPFVVEELLSAMVRSGSLAADGDRWGWDATITTAVPDTLMAAVRQRVERLGPASVAVLEAAAVLGPRFPIGIAAEMAGVAPLNALRVLRPAFEAELVIADESGDPGWYAFRHSLVVEAILGRLLPGERVALSRTAAEAVETSSADLRDDWCQLAAELWTAGGEPERAASLFARAGRETAARGALISAVGLLDRGLALSDGRDAPPDVVADLLETLVAVLGLRGDADRVIALGDRLDAALVAAGAPAGRRVSAKVAKARAYAAGGRWDAGLVQVAAARQLIEHAAGAVADPALTAPIDAVAAYLVLSSPRPDRLEAAAALAQRAVEAATAVPLPEVACEALEVLARCRRFHDFTAGEELFERSLAIATTHGLTTWRIRCELELGIIAKLRHHGTDRLHQARRTAEDAGAVIVMAWIDLHLATIHINLGEYEEALACAGRAGELARHLRLRELELLAAGAKAGVAAARGRRAEMEAALDELGDSVLGYGVEVWGHARGICALLEEERAEAFEHFRASAKAEAAVPNIRASGYRGVYLLLRAIEGEAGWPEYEALAGSALAQVDMHRPFLAWSRAVLLGRDGRHEDADAAAAEALTWAENQPTTRFLGGRLAAEAAMADGWGDPIGWLRAAESHYHAQQVPRLAAACRALLRQAGAQVTQRRRGHDRVPAALRQLGVTVREFEVLTLIADRLRDREIAERLFLSPRTVEKHVASLRARTGQADRAELVRFARQHLTELLRSASGRNGRPPGTAPPHLNRAAAPPDASAAAPEPRRRAAYPAASPGPPGRPGHAATRFADR